MFWVTFCRSLGAPSSWIATRLWPGCGWRWPHWRHSTLIPGTTCPSIIRQSSTIFITSSKCFRMMVSFCKSMLITKRHGAPNQLSPKNINFWPSIDNFTHRFVECYGKLGLLDYLHKTDKLFREMVNGSRHRVLFSLDSARERFPDKDKKL